MNLTYDFINAESKINILITIISLNIGILGIMICGRTNFTQNWFLYIIQCIKIYTSIIIYSKFFTKYTAERYPLV